jgi:hypothetical protein
LLQQYKLTDPAETQGHPNLTTERILEFEWTAPVRKCLNWANISLQQFRKKIQAARSKLIAHSDLRSRLSSVSLGEFSQADEERFWMGLAQFATAAHEETIGGPFEIDAVAQNGDDALTVLRALAEAVDYHDLVKEDFGFLASRSGKRRFEKL